MQEYYKNLGQVYPASGVLTAAYTVPAGRAAVISSIVVSNAQPRTTGISDCFNISHAIGGAADTPAQYLYGNINITPTNTFIATVGVTMAAGDVLRVYSQSGVLSFNLYGTEIF